MDHKKYEIVVTAVIPADQAFVRIEFLTDTDEIIAVMYEVVLLGMTCLTSPGLIVVEAARGCYKIPMSCPSDRVDCGIQAFGLGLPGR